MHRSRRPTSKSRPIVRPALSAAVVAVAACAALPRSAVAVDYYWDTNGDVAGSDVAGGTWDAGANWTTDAAGTTATIGWADGNNAVFSAGTSAGTWTTTVAGTVATPLIRSEEAATQTVTFTGGTITIGGGTIDTTALVAPAARSVVFNTTLAGTGGLTLAAHGDLTDSGGGSGSSLQLGGTNTFDGTVTVTAGLVRPTSDAAFGAAANAVVLQGGGLLATASVSLPNTRSIELSGAGDRVFRTFINQTFTVNGAITGTAGLRKTDNGTLVLTAANTYAGATTLAAGTLRLDGGNDRLPTATALTLKGGTFDLGANAQTIASVAFPQNATISTTVTGAGGSLTVNGTAAFQVGPGGALTTSPSTTLNMAGLTAFTYNAPAAAFRVGLPSGTTNTAAMGQVATATLAGSNAITAGTLAVADVGANNDGGAATLNLGTTNVLNVGAVNVGYSQRSDATLQFAAGLTSPNVTIRGTAGGTSAAATFNVGSVATFGGAAQTSFTSTVNLSAGTVDANVTSMTIGNADTGGSTNRVGTANGRFTMGAGTMNVGTLTLGRIAGTAAGSTGATTFTGDGVFTMNSAGGTLNVGTLTLAENTIASAAGASTRVVNGTFNLTNGTLRATTIRKGAQTGNATATATLNWTNGTIENTAGANLAITAVPVTLAAGTHTFNVTGSQATSLDAASPIGGAAGGIAKTGPGTLSTAAANTYLGGTMLSAGAVVLAAADALPSAGTVSFLGGTLDAGNFADATVGPLAIAGGASTLRFGSAGTGGSLLAFDEASFAAGTLGVINWDGLATGGGGDQFLVAGTVPASFLSAVTFANPAGFAPGTYPATAMDVGGGTFEVVPVPEPTAAATLLLAGGLLAGRRRRA